MELRGNAAYRAQHADKGVQHMQPGAGQPAAGRFLWRQSPARGDLLRVLVTVVAFDMKDRTQLAAGDDVAQCAQRWPKAPVVADGEDDAGLTAGIEHARRVGAAQGEWLFAKHLFACSGAGDDL